MSNKEFTDYLTYTSPRCGGHGGPAYGPNILVLRQVHPCAQLQEGEVILQGGAVPVRMQDLPLDSYGKATSGPG